MTNTPMLKTSSALILTAALFAIPFARAEQGLIVHKVLSLDMAMSMAQGSLEKCRSLGFQCAVTVLGATGRTIIALEDDGAALHRFEVAHKKAYTALIYRRPSRQVVEGWSKKTAELAPLQEGTMPSPPIEGTIALGGGLPIIVDKEVIGAIAVSGAPGWDMDEACAKAGLAKVADKLK
ncbi:MAG: heme-binding protein [Acidobacteriota bacterium]|nr:heme-binding protein [Acidobacteriota bacterium]